MKKSALTGGIDIFEGTYYKDLDLSLMSLAIDSTKKSRPKTREPGPEYLKTIDLNIYVTRREAISVDNNLATMSISPNLTVRGSAYAPALDGRAVVDEGSIIFQKAEFEITEGAIDFINPYKIEPEITLTSETTHLLLHHHPVGHRYPRIILILNFHLIRMSRMLISSP